MVCPLVEIMWYSNKSILCEWKPKSNCVHTGSKPGSHCQFISLLRKKLFTLFLIVVANAVFISVPITKAYVTKSSSYSSYETLTAGAPKTVLKTTIGPRICCADTEIIGYYIHQLLQLWKGSWKHLLTLLYSFWVSEVWGSYW